MSGGGGIAGAGVYGKVEGQPDFLRANAGEFSQAGLDLWFQDGVEGLGRERTALPEGATGFVMRGPASPSAFAGAFVPSTDAAGRSFPLVVFRRLGENNLAESFSTLPETQDAFVKAAGALAAAGRRLSGPVVVGQVESLAGSMGFGGASAIDAPFPLADGGLGGRSAHSVEALFAALGGTAPAVAYAMRTFATACDQAANMAKAASAGKPGSGVITVDAPAPSSAVRRFWLEMAQKRLGWRDTFPSFFWTEDGPASRLLMALGAPSPSTLCYLANPRHRASHFWPLRTEVPSALEQAMSTATPEQQRVVGNPRASLSDLASAFK